MSVIEPTTPFGPDRTPYDEIGGDDRIFTLLGRGSELATAYRRRMFNFMH